ncbi:hypothetical protein [Flavobacterium sp. N1736]|uniref:immunoglobulin domain-containing protein n=1 Tax=Flavobacterium sp. N1736 TaxID=2986823 RepID=UPI0022246461|nr:hypothetical protein [Flavobacterium sp. N1736]
MKKNLFYIWLLFVAMLFSVNTSAQVTIGGKKAPEAFSVLELGNKGGLRLPQLTTAERNAFTVSGNALANGLTIFNKTVNCVEYWNGGRWVSLCEGTSQITISPAACLTVATDGTGCAQEFSITDPDCPNGPFMFTIVAGGEYASLYNVDTKNGKFNVGFSENASVNARSVLVRVSSSCNNSFKDFLFSQNGVECTSMTYAVPVVSPSSSDLSLCSGGAVYLSVPANTANLDKLIWTRNGIEVSRGTSFFVATQKGKYNVSMGAVGCNTNIANERNVKESSTAAPAGISILSSNNGVICGTNAVKLTALGNNANVVWFHNGVQDSKTGAVITLNAAGDVGTWFAAIKEGNCFSQASNYIVVSKSAVTGQVSLNANDALVNGQPLNSFTAFCKGGSLDLSVANKQNGVTYTWYNGAEAISSNPFAIPASQTTILLSLVATDNTGAVCPAEINSTEKQIVTTGAPAQPDITGNNVLCNGTTDLTIVPQVAGTYTYTWYKGAVKMAATTPTITVNTPGEVYYATITNATGCSSTMATKVISPTVSNLPVLSWISKPATATFGANVTLQTAIEFGPAVSYTWSATNGAAIIGSGASVTIQLPASGTDGLTVEVKVTAVNACGKSIELIAAVVLNNACPTPVLTAQSELVQTITSGAGAPVSVSVSGGVSPTYQWYSNTTASTSGGAMISGATTASYSYKPAGPGISYVYCIVTNGCVGSYTAASPVFTITTQVSPDTIPPGSGTLNGRTCFDIAESNDNATCGTLVSRTSNKANFALSTVNTQVYTFTPYGAVSKVRFMYVESLTGNIVQSMTASGKEDALNVSGAVTTTLIYKSTLSSGGAAGTGAAYGKTDASALSVTIYAVYNNKADGSGTDVQVKLKASIKDCSCCGAMISPTVWKNFLCHNLGADVSLDPFVGALGILGNYYQYGLKEPRANIFDYLAPVGSIDSTWGANGIKTSTDPCPTGFRVPTVNEWKGVLDNNSSSRVGSGSASTYDKGVKIGSLFLPLVGYISYLGSRAYVGVEGRYLAANGQVLVVGDIQYGMGIYGTDARSGSSVRCIAE